jgi:hypothetical protein
LLTSAALKITFKKIVSKLICPTLYTYAYKSRFVSRSFRQVDTWKFYSISLRFANLS